VTARRARHHRLGFRFRSFTVRFRIIRRAFRVGSNLGRTDVGPYPTLSDPIPDSLRVVKCRVPLYTIRGKFARGLFRIGSASGRIDAGPYPTPSDPISMPYLAVTCRMQLHWIRFRFICGLFRIGCDHDRIDVGSYPILSEPIRSRLNWCWTISDPFGPDPGSVPGPCGSDPMLSEAILILM
jgi:hypothetical protein